MSQNSVRLAYYIQAEADILLKGQSIGVNGRTRMCANLAEIRKQIQILSATESTANRGPLRIGNSRVSS